MVNKIDLLSDGDFIELINNSSSTSDVLKSLGYSVKGNSWAYRIVAERMDKLNITFGKKLSINKQGIIERLPIEKVLTENSEYNRTKLKERLVQEGLKEYKCECCGISEWMGKPISLQLHHLNGINNDNRLNNLQLLCPNCHSQTENFGTKGKGLVIKRKCDNLPKEDIKKIMTTVSELGIVQARKVLPYRNSLINSIVKANKELIIMVDLQGNEKEFSTAYEASKYLFNNYGIGSNPESSRTGISKCYNGKQKSIKGFKFYKRSASA
jgi:Zn finger protein HypA/HybF involved in hydrogenase expression